MVVSEGSQYFFCDSYKIFRIRPHRALILKLSDVVSVIQFLALIVGLKFLPNDDKSVDGFTSIRRHRAPLVTTQDYKQTTEAMVPSSETMELFCSRRR